MRLSLPAAFLLSILLAACTANRDATRIMPIPQSGPLKVNPGLLGQPTPPAAQTPQAAPAASAAAEPATPPRPPAEPAATRPLDSIYFDYNSAEPKAGDEAALRAHARYLAANPQARVRIEGNADERGSERFNLSLGERRAAAVRDRLLANGAAAGQVAIKSLGKSQPRRAGSDEQSWAENRRADVIYENGK